MGIFTRRRAAVAEWQPDGTGVMSNGDCGGDDQDGESYSVRYVRPDIPGSLITVSFYPVIFGEVTHEWAVEEETEFMVCEDPTDPGGTEVWSEYHQRDVNDRPLYSQADAEQMAREFAENALTTADDINWDGEPFRHGSES